MHTDYLKKALEQAQLRQGRCAPNPAVGAVVVKNNQIISAGFHQGPGTPHAEVMALQSLEPAELMDATLYVTLEPCCHHGRTPPCTDFILKKGIRQVVYAYQDPNPIVQGAGHQQLSEAGVRCEQVAVSDIDQFYRAYTRWTQTKRPWVIAKLAVSIDGKIAGASGQRVQITGPELQHLTHLHRQKADAILTTATTVCNDDPQLNVRLSTGTESKPVFVIDRQLKTPMNARLFETAKSLTLFHESAVLAQKIEAFKKKGVDCVEVSVKDQSCDLDHILSEIGRRGVHTLWVEAGSRLFYSLIQQQCIDEAYLYFSSREIGVEGIPAFKGQDVFERARFTGWQVVSNDIIAHFEWRNTIDVYGHC